MPLAGYQPGVMYKQREAYLMPANYCSTSVYLRSNTFFPASSHTTSLRSAYLFSSFAIRYNQMSTFLSGRSYYPLTFPKTSTFLLKCLHRSELLVLAIRTTEKLDSKVN